MLYLYTLCSPAPPEETEPGLKTIHCRWIVPWGDLTQDYRDVSGPSIYPSTVHQNHNERLLTIRHPYWYKYLDIRKTLRYVCVLRTAQTCTECIQNKHTNREKCVLTIYWGHKGVWCKNKLVLHFQPLLHVNPIYVFPSLFSPLSAASFGNFS